MSSPLESARWWWWRARLGIQTQSLLCGLQFFHGLSTTREDERGGLWRSWKLRRQRERERARRTICGESGRQADVNMVTVAERVSGAAG